LQAWQAHRYHFAASGQVLTVWFDYVQLGCGHGLPGILACIKVRSLFIGMVPSHHNLRFCLGRGSKQMLFRMSAFQIGMLQVVNNLLVMAIPEFRSVSESQWF
jgi:hypothetical protein